MKKSLLVISGLLLACNFMVFSQVILTSKTHGLIPNTQNPMKLIEYIEAGSGGQGVVWDFSMIKEKDSFQGELIENNGVSEASKGANVILKEFSNYFTFNCNEDQLEQIGYYSGESGDVYTRYDESFIKMKYPFTYGNAYTGVFSGSQYQKDKKLTSFTGSYEVSADGIGTLTLPNGIVYKNALRVKEVKRTNYGTSPYEEITYRWYLKNYRFPVLVFIKTGSTNGGGCKSFLSAYNPNIPVLKSTTDLDESQDANISVFPNPSTDIVNTKIILAKEATVIIGIYDATGKYIGSVANNKYNAGEQVFSINAKSLSLKYGIYFLKIAIDGNESVKNFVIE